jgi:hypothetical protein
MTVLKDLKVLLILVLGIVLLLTQLKNCNIPPSEPTIVVEVDTVYQTVEVKVPEYVPKYVTKIVEKKVEVKVPVDVDTAAILKDYYTSYKVVDTVSLPYSATDTTIFGNGIITDVITQNKITKRSILWNYSIPIIKETITKYPEPTNQVYIGFNTAMNTTQIVNNVSGGIILKTKRDRIYQGNIGFVDVGDKVTTFVGGGMYWKIRLKKK